MIRCIFAAMRSARSVSLMLGLIPLAGLVGCDGASTAGGPSLDDRFRAAMQIENPESRAKQLIRVASEQHQAGDLTGAVTSLDQAETASQRIADAVGAVQAYNLLASAQARMNMKDRAKRTLVKVRRLAEEVQDVEIRIQTLARMALTQGEQLQRQDAAAEELAEAEALLQSQADSAQKVQGLVLLAYVHHKLNQAESFERLLQLAVELTGTIADPRQQASAWGHIADCQFRTGHTSAGMTAVDGARQAIERIEEAVSQGHALVDLAQRLQAVDRAGASDLLVQAERTGDRVVDRGLRRELMEKIAAARQDLL